MSGENSNPEMSRPLAEKSIADSGMRAVLGWDRQISSYSNLLYNPASTATFHRRQKWVFACIRLFSRGLDLLYSRAFVVSSIGWSDPMTRATSARLEGTASAGAFV